MHKLLRDFEIQTDHLILARQPDLVIINKKNLLNSGPCCSGWPQIKIESSKKKAKYFNFAKELKKLWNIKVTVILIVIGTLGTVTKGLVQIWGLGNKRMSRDHSKYSIWNQPEYRGESWRLAVTQTPVRNHQLTLVWKTRKELSNNNTNPGNTNPGNTNPGNTNPGNTNPGNTNPGNTNPGNTKKFYAW